MPPRGPEQAVAVPRPQHDLQESERTRAQAESTKQVAETSSVASPPKVDYATDLFNMLSTDDAGENSSDNVNNDENAWAGFQSAGQPSAPEKTDLTKTVESSKQSASGIEDLFVGSSSFTSSAPEKPQKDVKSDIMSLFEKSNMVSPFSIHQQQLVMLAQQQSLLMAAAAAAESANGASKSPANMQQLGLLNGTNMPTSNWPNIGYQIPGMTMPLGGQNELQKFMQVGNHPPTHKFGNPPSYSPASFYSMGQPMPANGITNMETSKIPTASTVSSQTSTQSAKDCDFSSLTQGLFSKR
ncbi:hypothetical protein Nepgr_007505 [Nepenthes gracilis]|uniref:ADP-ribosylation factor GTPase-activating protein AGD5 n=1 Tax=Nepenthes gracilis TaxID=150966 RepID=A0AAD3S711_NEPGR|nr:hypothetical protein Nepgr_007505 [Nepenthes gracilis]